MRAMCSCNDACWAMARTMPAIQSTPASVPLVPQLPTMRGKPTRRARVSRMRRARATAGSAVLGGAGPRRGGGEALASDGCGGLRNQLKGSDTELILVVVAEEGDGTKVGFASVGFRRCGGFGSMQLDGFWSNGDRDGRADG